MTQPFSGDADAIADLTYSRYRDYINPGMADLLRFTGLSYPEWEAEGCIIRDVAGDEYIDCVAGYGVFSLGHRHPRVVEAVRRQLDLLTLKTHYFLDIGLGEVGEKLAAISPGRLQYAFLCNSGTEAVEGALKAARIHTGRSKVIGAVNGFHGKTYGALSASGRELYKKGFRPLLEGFGLVPFGDTEAMAGAVDDETAAVILEVVQGEGGVNVAPPGYLAEVRRITSEAGVLLIVDEVRTGLGRTGRMFAAEHDGIEPDLLTMAKALGGGVMPVGAFLGTPEIWESMFGTNPYLHSTTFGGNPLACAAAIAAIDATQELGLVKRSEELGRALVLRLRGLQERYGDWIADVRGLGLLAGVEFRSDDVAKLVIAGCARAGLLVAYSLNNPLVIRIEPPLIIEEELLDRALGIFEDSVRSTVDMLAAMAV